MSRWKAIPWLLGVALLAVALVAALRLPSPDTAAGGGGGGGSPSATPVGGLTVVGTVDALPGVLAVSPPGVMGMPALTVKKVHVKDGDSVEPDAVLVEFDAAAVEGKLKTAKEAVTAAEWKAATAVIQQNDQKYLIEKADLAVEKVETDLKYAKETRDRATEIMERELEKDVPGLNRKRTEDEKKQLRRDNLDLLKAEGAVELFTTALKNARLDRKRLDNTAADADVQAANAQVAVLKAQLAEAQAAVDAYTLKAKVGGTVEQIAVAEGMTVGPAARTPLLYLVPKGPRVVRAEVEAEFAHKIEGFLGKAVTIYDAHNFNNTYTGVAQRVNGAFLPKRFGGDSLVGTPTRALECTITIPDPAPPGKPPLRPGQPVRVMFGQ